MKHLPLNSYPGRFVKLALATTFEDLKGKPVLMPPGEVVEVLWVCNRSKQLLDVRVRGQLYVTSAAKLNVCGQILPMSRFEHCEFGLIQPCAA